jgi:hypothetical protein
MKIARLVVLAAVALAPDASAQIDDRLTLTGGVEAYAGLQLSADPDFLAARTRAEAALAFGYERGRIVARSRLTHDALTETLRGELREAFADVFFPRVDLRVGHQLIVWGRTDGAFITDLLAPLDLSEFLAQPFEDIRLALTAATATVFLGDFEIAAVLVPRRPSSRVPEPGSPWFPGPEEVLGIPVVMRESADADDVSIGMAENALRLTWRGLPRSDVSLNWINGFNRIPAFRRGVEAQLQPFRPRLVLTPEYYRRQVLGLSGETLALDPFVVRLEAAYHTRHFLDQPVILPTTLQEATDPEFIDAVERGFLIAKPFAEAAVGVERRFGAHTVSVQGIARFVFDHDDRVAMDAFEPAASLLWLGRFHRDTITARLFALYHFDRDFWVNPELAHAVHDGLNVSLGAQFFGGRGPDRDDLESFLREPSFRFSTFRDNSFAYLRLSYRF